MSIARDLVAAGLDRFGHQYQPGLVAPRTVTETDLAGWDPVGHNHSDLAVRRIGFGKDPVGWRPDHHTVVVLGTEMGPVGRRSGLRTVAADLRIETFSLRVVIEVSSDERVNYEK